jgi:hypothetical protein
MVVLDGSEREAIPAVPAMDKNGLPAPGGLPYRPARGPVAAPCPMCKKGAMIDQAGTSLRYERRGTGNTATVKAVGTQQGAGFWKDVPETVTWQDGLCVRHVRRCQFHREGSTYSCGRPAVGQWCDHHEDAANRLERPWERFRPAVGGLVGAFNLLADEVVA